MAAMEEGKRSEERREEKQGRERGQWVRAAVLGANDGLVSTAAMMIGVGAVKSDAKAMLLAGFAATVAGALSMAIGEFVSVCTQRDIEKNAFHSGNSKNEDDDDDDAALANPWKAAFASAGSFIVGAAVPLMSGGFISAYLLRLIIMSVASSAALAVFGGLGAAFGRACIWRGSVRVTVGGWVAMLLAFGLLKLFGKASSSYA